MISATELTELMENLGQKMTYDKLTKIMAGFDKDHNGSIEFWEFMRMFRSQLLDLQEILDYIKLNPSADTAAAAVAPSVRPHPSWFAVAVAPSVCPHPPWLRVMVKWSFTSRWNRRVGVRIYPTRSSFLAPFFFSALAWLPCPSSYRIVRHLQYSSCVLIALIRVSVILLC